MELPWLWTLAALAGTVAASWLLPGFRAGVWSPTPRDVVERALELADPRPGERLVDLGYGDGRFLLAAARRGARAVGYDINPLWGPWVSLRARLLRVADRVELRRQDFFAAHLGEADAVVMFLSQAAADRLAGKLRRELRPDARVVSYRRPLPGWHPERTVEVRPGKLLYLYRQTAGTGPAAPAGPPPR